LARTKNWHGQNTRVDRIYCRQQNISVDKKPALTKSRCWQNVGVTKYWRWQNIGVNKKLAKIKCWRRRRRIPLLFGSTAADFSQILLKISYISLMMLIPVHAVAKYGVASGRPAFMGGLSSVLYRLIVPARNAENIINFGADKILASA
jgi:hypothetical protein